MQLERLGQLNEINSELEDRKFSVLLRADDKYVTQQSTTIQNLSYLDAMADMEIERNMGYLNFLSHFTLPSSDTTKEESEHELDLDKLLTVGEDILRCVNNAVKAAESRQQYLIKQIEVFETVIKQNMKHRIVTDIYDTVESLQDAGRNNQTDSLEYVPYKVGK